MRKKKGRDKGWKKKRRKLTKRGRKEAMKCTVTQADPAKGFRRLLEGNEEADFGQERTTYFGLAFVGNSRKMDVSFLLNVGA